MNMNVLLLCSAGLFSTILLGSDEKLVNIENLDLKGYKRMILTSSCSTDSQSPNQTTIVRPDILDRVKTGELKGAPIKLGSTKKDVIKKLGKPSRTGNEEYGFAMYYKEYTYVFEDYANSLDELGDESKVVMIHAEPKTIALTENAEQIKKLLGEPTREIVDDTGTDTIILRYIENEYVLNITFVEREQAPIDVSIRLK